jgi:hypothetical protein
MHSAPVEVGGALDPDPTCLRANLRFRWVCRNRGAGTSGIFSPLTQAGLVAQGRVDTP